MGGGLSLLQDVVRKVSNDKNYLVILDKRVSEIFEKIDLKNVKYFSPGIIGRLNSEIYLKYLEKNINKVLSFNSLPFILSYQFDVSIFFQNVNLLSNVKASTPKLFLKKLVFNIFVERTDTFIVQSKAVASNLELVLGSDKKCEIITLLDEKIFTALWPKKSEKQVENLSGIKKTFIYPADNLPHKNHVKLLEGWELFRSQFPDAQIELILTIAETNNKISNTIFEDFDFSNLAISNKGTVNRDVVFELYEQSDVLLFPSLSESLGLPLLEAKAMGLDIIASDVDYVFDAVSPSQVFNPNSAVSIARSIARYLGFSWPSSLRPMTASSFLEHVFGVTQKSDVENETLK